MDYKYTRRKTIQWIAAINLFFFAVTMTDLARASVIFVSDPAESSSREESRFQRAKAPSIFNSVSEDMLTLSSNLIYFNGRGQVQAIIDKDRDGILIRRDFIYRPGGELERIDSRKLFEFDYVLESATYFTGPKGKERPYQVITFDEARKTNFIYFLIYHSKNGALVRVDQRRLNEALMPLVTSTLYTGAQDLEVPIKILSYEYTGMQVRNRIDYVYQGTAIREIVQRKADDDTSSIYSKTLFMGLAGQERLTAQYAYDDKGNIMSRSDFFYNHQGLLNHSETREGEELALPIANIMYFKSNLPSHLISLDPKNGALLGRSEFVYDASGVLKQINLKEGNETTPVRNTTFVSEDLNGEMVIDHALTYDKTGEFQNRHDFTTNAEGRLTQIETRWVDDIRALRRIVTVFTEEHGVNIPKYEVTLDSKGNVINHRTFSFGSADRLNPSDPEHSHKAVLANSNTPLLSGPPQKGQFLSDLPTHNGTILKNHSDFAHDLQGVMNQILVRAGPMGGLY